MPSDDCRARRATAAPRPPAALLALILALGVAGCGKSAEPPPPPVRQQAPAPALAIGAEGLRLFDPVSGTATPLAFGTPWPRVAEALAFRGQPAAGTNEECGAGPLQFLAWPDGLTLYGQDGAFAGWSLAARDGGTLVTDAGVGPGTTRANLEDVLEARVFQSSLGTEFEAGGLSGVLDGDGAAAKVTHIQAGANCTAR